MNGDSEVNVSNNLSATVDALRLCGEYGGFVWVTCCCRGVRDWLVPPEANSWPLSALESIQPLSKTSPAHTEANTWCYLINSHGGKRGLNKSMCKIVYFKEKNCFWCNKTGCGWVQIAICQIWWAWLWQWHLAPTSWHQVSLSSSVLLWKLYCQGLTVTWQQATWLVTVFALIMRQYTVTLDLYKVRKECTDKILTL